MDTPENKNYVEEEEREKLHDHCRRLYVIVDYERNFFECTTIRFKCLKRYCTSNSH